MDTLSKDNLFEHDGVFPFPLEGKLSTLTRKELKEKFVSNLHGSTMLEIAALSAVVPTFVLLRQICGLYLSASVNRVNEEPTEKKWSEGKRYLITLLTDFVFVALPTLALTILSHFFVYALTAISVCFTTVGIAGLLRLYWRAEADFTPALLSDLTKPQKTFLSSFRFTMVILPRKQRKQIRLISLIHFGICVSLITHLDLSSLLKVLVTCVSILAVDFNIFPRRYAKTEAYGTGLMDVGVGSFVVANGLVSRQAWNMPPSHEIKDILRKELSRKYGGVLRNTSPLLLLGFLRLILTKGVDYQEHVVEYGIHWNFFFTLAAVTLLTSIIHVPVSLCGTLGVIVLGVHQAILLSGVNEYLLSSQRGPSLISLNKEGIYNIPGYWSMYLLSVQFGHYFFSIPKRIFSKKDDDSSNNGRKLRSQSWKYAVNIWPLNAIFWILAIIVDRFVEKISRRMCNLGYVIFVFAMNLEVIAIFLTADLLLPLKPMLLLQIVDRNLLATFLWGNILTSIVNMIMDTISVSAPAAFITMLGYLIGLIGGMATVEMLNLKLKFW